MKNYYLELGVQDVQRSLGLPNVDVSIFLTSVGYSVFGKLDQTSQYKAVIEKTYAEVKEKAANKTATSTEIKLDEAFDYTNDNMMLSIPKKDGMDVLIQGLWGIKVLTDNFKDDDNYYLELNVPKKGKKDDPINSSEIVNALAELEISGTIYEVEKQSKKDFETENHIDENGNIIIERDTQEQMESLLTGLIGEQVTVNKMFEVESKDGKKLNLFVLPTPIIKNGEHQGYCFRLCIDKNSELFEKVLKNHSEIDKIYRAFNGYYYTMKKIKEV